jgi:hypothetical protein
MAGQNCPAGRQRQSLGTYPLGICARVALRYSHVESTEKEVIDMKDRQKASEIASNWKRHSKRVPKRIPSIRVKGARSLVPFFRSAPLFGYQVVTSGRHKGGRAQLELQHGQ